MRELMNIVEGLNQVDELVSALKTRFQVNLSLSYNNTKNTMTLHKIIVPKEQRGTGVGTSVMTEICALADQLGAKLTLTPSSDFGGSVSKLIAFYSKFGFVQNKGKNKDFEISDLMYRLPK